MPTPLLTSETMYVNPAAFSDQELLPTMREVNGPVDNFTIDAARKAAAKEHAEVTGELVGDFAECPPLGDMDQKTARQEAKRGLEVLAILDETDDGSLEPRLVRRYAEYKVWQGVVVEASRRSLLANRAGQPEQAEWYDEQLARGLGELYEAPTREKALTCLAEFRPHVEVVREHGPAELRPFADDITRQYEVAMNGAVEPVRLKPEIAEAIRDKLQERFGQAFAELREEFGDISNDKIVEVSKRLLERIGLSKVDEEGNRSGWDAMPNEKRTGFYTSSKKEQLECGKRSQEITWENYEKLMVHELGVHAIRTVNGRKLGKPLLEVELPGAADFEEGLGILFEEIWSGEQGVGRDHYRYLIAAYATGALDGQPHDKNQTYQFITGLKAVELAGKKLAAGKEVDVPKQRKSARSTMFEHTFRAFRGMPEGQVMIKDGSYYDSKTSIIKSCNDSDLPVSELVHRLTLAKINSLNEDQLQYAMQAEAEQAA